MVASGFESYRSFEIIISKSPTCGRQVGPFHETLSFKDKLFEVLSDAFPLWEFHLQVFIIEEQGRLSHLAFQLPIEPLHYSLGIVATMLLVIRATVTVLRVNNIKTTKGWFLSEEGRWKVEN